MPTFEDDPILNSIQNGIKDDIEFNLSHKRFTVAVILIYSGIDGMAFLDMPVGQDDVTGADFVKWADRYVCVRWNGKVTGADFYGARCAMLHTYGVASKKSRQRKCRMIGYLDQSSVEVISNS